MISTSSEMILNSVVFSFFFGILCSLFHTLIQRLSELFLRVIRALRKKDTNSYRDSRSVLNVLDFFFTILVGCVYILFTYVLLDGVFDYYSLIMLFLTFIVGKRLFYPIFVFGKKNR